MAKLSHTDSRRKYSWWWDSHISPKNSKWLQENLTDMDVKVKSMIKLLEEDADSFARRAEMYYKKRPELMKLVEEFYRAYRALAERYDHATGVIRHAHHTMAEAFPNQDPSFVDDSPRTPPNGEFMEESDSAIRRKAMRQLNESFGLVDRVRKGLTFDDEEEKNETNHSEILSLKEAIAKLEAEKEAGLSQYQQSLDKLSHLESEISRIQEDFRVLNDHATKAENEVVVLKEALSEMETEKQSKLQDYQECLDKISRLQNIEKKLDERATSAETESQSLKTELDKLNIEKDAALNQYMESLVMISNLENKLRLTEEDVIKLKERADNAESEVEILKQTISKLTEEKEALALQYQHCLEKISSLENKLSSAEEEAKRLNMEIDNGVSKLKGAEEQCLLLEKSNKSLHSELESLMLNMGTQTQELTDKNKELGRLWTCVQEERLRFVEAETAFQTLQHLHAQTQEELHSMASELQNRAQLLKVSETHNQNLQDEVLKSASSIKDMQNEIFSLRESKGNLEEEVELRIDQRNALQQEIYCLKEELNALKNENFNLKETCLKESSEKAALLEKLVILEQLLEKNSILENSLSDLNAELDATRGKIEELEQSCQSLFKEKSTLLDEKATLMIQLQETSKNLEKLSENNNVLVNSLSDAHYQLEALKAKSKILEDSCQLLVNEKAGLISEKVGLTSQLEKTQIRLENFEKIYGELEGRCITLEKERESTLLKVQELQMSFDVERQWRKKELDQVIDNAIDEEIEIFVLRITAQEMKENHCSVIIENQKLLEESSLSEKKISHLEKTNLEQSVEIKSLSDQASSLRGGISQLLKVLNIGEDHAFKDKIELDKVYVNRLLEKLQSMKESLCNFEEENQKRNVELSVLVTWIKELGLYSQDLEVKKNNIESEVLTVLDINEELNSKLREEDCNKEALMTHIEDLKWKLTDKQREKLEISEEKRSLMDNFLHLEEKNNVLEEKNCDLSGQVLSLENLSFIFRTCVHEKLLGLRELGDDLNKFMEKLSLTEGKLEQSRTENLHLHERLQKSEDELKSVSTIKDQLSNEIEKGKDVMHKLELELHEAEQKISFIEKEKLELNQNVESVQMDYNEVKIVSNNQKNQILKLSADNDCRKIEQENLQFELQKKINEINELETEVASVFGQFQYSMVSQLLYEQKFHELNEACLGYVEQNEDLKNQLAAFGPEIESLKDSISSLEKQTYIHIKLQNPENEESQVDQYKKESMPNTLSDLRDMRARLQEIEKAAVDIKDLMVQENVDLHTKLDASMRQLELLQSESGRYRRNLKPSSEIIEADNALLTKDIMLDQVSDGSSYRFSKREPIEVWETADPHGTIGLTMGKSKKTVSPDIHRVKSMRKQKGERPISESLVVDKLEISKRFTDPLQEGNKRKVLERLDSDVQKLANLQITVQDLKRKLGVTEKGKRGKAVIECEALKGQLEEADISIMKLFDLNDRLMKSIDGSSSFSEVSKSSFDLEGDESGRRRRVSEQARRMSEKIGRLQLEVQKLQFVLLKLDDEKDGKSKISETKRRVLLRDYLYGAGRVRQGRKKAHFCACVEPSTQD
ncbi:hypothetical protein ACJIZ3_011773 [Penstemon smallii]|uniref:NAB domain-containing protein n=1 Tax=Penstemon smallii TaxID=265156 RepID=A0ABD3UK30_9LAMI